MARLALEPEQEQLFEALLDLRLGRGGPLLQRLGPRLLGILGEVRKVAPGRFKLIESGQLTVCRRGRARGSLRHKSAAAAA